MTRKVRISFECGEGGLQLGGLVTDAALLASPRSAARLAVSLTEMLHQLSSGVWSPEKETRMVVSQAPRLM